MQNDDAMKVVWFSEIKWTYLKTRKQQIIENFPPDWEVLFIESFVLGKNNQFQPVRDGRVTYATVPFFKATPYPLINKLQVLWPFRTVIEWIASLWVLWLCRKTGFDAPERVIATSNIYYADIIRRMKKKAVIYDCNDYPLGFTTKLSFATSYYKKTLAITNSVVTVSMDIARKIKEDGRRSVSLVGNGVDYSLFSKQQPKPSEYEGLTEPIIIYAGAISDWFDTDLLFKLCEAIPASRCFMIGPILSKRVQDTLQSSACPQNITWLGPKKHHELPAYVAHAAACIIPFLKNELTRGLNPNKMYEYLASGKSVVTLDFSEEIIALKEVVHVATSHEEFIKYVQVSFSESMDTSKRQSVAFENSWQKKSEAFTEIINQMVL